MVVHFVDCISCDNQGVTGVESRMKVGESCTIPTERGRRRRQGRKRGRESFPLFPFAFPTFERPLFFFLSVEIGKGPRMGERKKKTKKKKNKSFPVAITRLYHGVPTCWELFL